MFGKKKTALVKQGVALKPEDLPGIRGPITLAGPMVSASTEEPIYNEDWVIQPIRAGKSGFRGAKDSPVYLVVHSDMAAELKKYRLADVRFAYDGYFKWLLDQDQDCVLIAGFDDGEGTWISEIHCAGGAIESISERRLSHHTHSMFRVELADLLEETESRLPGIYQALSLYGCGIDEGFGGHENIGLDAVKKSRGSVDFGHFRMPWKHLGPLCLSVILLWGYVGYKFWDMNQRINEQLSEFSEAIAGVEDQYERGMTYVKLLEAQRSFLRDSHRQLPVSTGVDRIMNALSRHNGLLLLELSLAKGKSGRELEIEVAIIKDDALDVIEQLRPVIEDLAAATGKEVGVEGAGEQIYPRISNTILFRTAKMTASLESGVRR